MVQPFGLCLVGFKLNSTGQHRSEPCTVGVWARLVVAYRYVVGACG